MTADAFSDLVLFLVCAWLAYANFRDEQEPAGFGLTFVLIGLAAGLGILRFSSYPDISDAVKGAHQFASLVAAVGAFPIWAFSLAHPESALARRLAGAWWLTFVVGGFGVGIWTLGFKLWSQLIPALCALWMAWTVLRGWRGQALWWGVAGLACLFSSFAAALLLAPQVPVIGFVTKTQLLHYWLALALVLLNVGRIHIPKGR